MRTVGIDLSSRPPKTAMCEIEWRDGSAYVRDLTLGVTDEAILKRVADLKEESEHDGDWAIGIDAPFGWPRPFIEFIGRAPGEGPILGPKPLKDLYYRLTDLRVIKAVGIFPLVVAADKIAHAAIRCADLLVALAVVDRSGVDGVFEVYPAAALKAWGLPHQGYKGPSPGAQQKLKQLFCDEIYDWCDPWLTFAPGLDKLCETNDHAFDALIAALVTRAAALGCTVRPNDDEMDRATTEGWIAIPKEDCKLGDLVTGAVGSQASPQLSA